MSVKYSKCPLNISTFSDLRPSKIYPNWDFWFENKPPGNPGDIASASGTEDHWLKSRKGVKAIKNVYIPMLLHV
jgi:hypothetical protein